MKKIRRFIPAILMGLLTAGLSLITAKLSILTCIVIGLITAVIVYAMWHAKYYKEFSDADRVKATCRALGGSGPPELWTPDIKVKRKKSKIKLHKKQ